MSQNVPILEEDTFNGTWDNHIHKKLFINTLTGVVPSTMESSLATRVSWKNRISIHYRLISIFKLEVEFSCEGGNSLVGPAMFVPPIIFSLPLFMFIVIL